MVMGKLFGYLWNFVKYSFYLILALALFGWMLERCGIGSSTQTSDSKKTDEEQEREKQDKIEFLNNLENYSLKCQPPNMENPRVTRNQTLYILEGDYYSEKYGQPRNSDANKQFLIRLSKEKNAQDFQYYELFKIASNGSVDYVEGTLQVELSEYGLTGSGGSLYRDSLKFHTYGKWESQAYSGSLANRGLGEDTNLYGAGYFTVEWVFDLVSQCEQLETNDFHGFAERLGADIREQVKQRLIREKQEKEDADALKEREQMERNRI
jgi:hypothetical protein